MNKIKIVTILSILFVFINITVYAVLEINEKQRIKIALDSHLEKLEAYFDMLMHNQTSIADAAFKTTINKQEVINILKSVKADGSKENKNLLREKLQNILKKEYQILKEEGVLQYHFVLPSNEVFLRMHKPSKFGDNLADVRYSFKYVNSIHKQSHGFEQGRTSHGFRNVYPIFDENENYLAAIEISFSSDDIQEHLTDIGKIHTHFLAHKNLLQEKAWTRSDNMDKYVNSAEHEDYRITMTKNHTKEKCINENIIKLKSIKKKIDEKISLNKKFSLYTIYDESATILSFYPIKNIKDKKVVAWLVSYEKDDFIYMTLKTNTYIQIIAFLVLSILFYFIYRVINQRIVLDTQIAEKNEVLIQNKKESWIKEGTNGLNIKLSQNSDIISISNEAINYLCEYLNAGVGALYIYDVDDESLHLSGSYAFVHRQELSNVFKLGEGVVGQTALQRTPIHLENITREHMLISTGTTSEPPLNIYTFPLLYQDELYGVIEIGSTALFAEVDIELFKSIDDVIATKIFSAIQNKKVKDLLLKSQESNNVLEEKRNELKESNSQMQEQQAQLEEANSQMQEQQAQLEEANSQMQEQQAQLEEANSQMEEQQVQLKESAKELSVQNNQLEKAKDEVEKKASALEESSRYKSEFLANMSHELRTPLNSIILLSNMLGQNKHKTLNEEDMKKAHIINDSGEELLRLINDVLDLSKIEAGRMDLLVSSFDSGEFIQKIKETFEHSILDKGLKFIVKDLYNSTVTTDENKLSQILRNFISNSLKFTPSGTIELIIESTASNEVKISVKDSGIGIAKDKQKLIFKAFTQADGSTSREYGGTGLGLSITKNLAKLIGGEISLESEEKKGSVFSVVFSNFESSAISPPKAKVEPKKDKIKIAPKKIIDDADKITPDGRVFLVIEDNEIFAQTLKSVINDKGDYALIATTGMDGLDLAMKYSNIEGILLDLGLPDIDGVDVLKRLKSDIHTRKIPVYIISGRDNEKNLDISQAVGFKQKPLSSNDLKSVFNDFSKLSESETIKELLIVEDDDIQREAMIEFIANEELNTTGVASVESAIEEINKNIYDAVVVDLTLMDSSGLEVCDYIKSHELDIPIIVYTGKDLSLKEEQEIKKYTDSIIIKSVNSQVRLLEEVDTFLHRVKTPTKKDKNRVSISDIKFENTKILLVDDDMRNIFVIVEILEERGAEVLTASNGEEALELLDKNMDTNIILMDIMMPIMDGYETIKRVRANSATKDIPIIAVTAKSMPEDREKAMKVGANDCLNKPLNLDTFIGVLKAWIK